MIDAKNKSVSPDCYIGPDVQIEAENVQIAPGCRIGFSGEDDFRTPGGVRIRVKSLELGPNVVLGRNLRISGGDIRIGESVRILRNTTINVLDEFELGGFGTIGENCTFAGRKVRIGQEGWILPYALIGGGSAYERASELEVGHFFHLGQYASINTARPVRIGNEVGLGTGTRLFTHGAYSSRLSGFPVAFDSLKIGDFTWIPGAIVNPGVCIGRHCVIGVNSLVATSIPDGCFAAGSPAKIIRPHAYPCPLPEDDLIEFFDSFLEDYAFLSYAQSKPERTGAHICALLTQEASYICTSRPMRDFPFNDKRTLLVCDHMSGPFIPSNATIFNPTAKTIRGIADPISERFKNELRRYGIRFYSRPIAGRYADWANPCL